MDIITIPLKKCKLIKQSKEDVSVCDVLSLRSICIKCICHNIDKYDTLSLPDCIEDDIFQVLCSKDYKKFISKLSVKKFTNITRV